MDRPEAGLQFRRILQQIGVSMERGKRGLVVREDIARAAGCDASSITLLAQGRSMSATMTRQVAQALLTFNGARREDTDLWLWLCGYSLEVSTGLRDQMIRARALPLYQQRHVACAMRAVIDRIRGEEATAAAEDMAPPTSTPTQRAPLPLKSPRPQRVITTLAERLRKALG